jgi:hypothetical protein
MELKTGYEWCLQNRVRPLNLNQWKSDKTYSVKSFYEEKIDNVTFMGRIQKCDVKTNSTPRKTEMFLGYRMYGLVPYNLSPIQQGIQFGHAVVEYQQNAKAIPNVEAIYDKWAQKDKTFIILNGGTTSENPERLGTLQNNAKLIEDNGVLTGRFYEYDLNDTLTAVVFLVDERVYNRELYPDFVTNGFYTSDENEKQYNEWLKKIGGKTNEFLRSFLPTFKLA